MKKLFTYGMAIATLFGIWFNISQAVKAEEIVVDNEAMLEWYIDEMSWYGRFDDWDLKEYEVVENERTGDTWITFVASSEGHYDQHEAYLLSVMNHWYQSENS